MIDEHGLAACQQPLHQRVDVFLQQRLTARDFDGRAAVAFHLRDDLCTNLKIDTKALNPVCRLGGPNYAHLGDIITMPTVGRTEQMVIFPKT